MRTLGTALLATAIAILPASSAVPLTKAEIDRWMGELSNWGRWGKTDERGTLNLITPRTTAQAASLVRKGLLVSLATASTAKEIDNDPPLVHTMVSTGQDPKATFAIDIITTNFHGFGTTHLDALCHMFAGKTMYNGFPRELVGPKGAARLSVANMSSGIAGRGILMDIPRLKQVPYLEPGQPISPEDLDAWEQRCHLKVGAGDIVIIRTGRWARRAMKGPWNLMQGSAGLSARCAAWLRKRDVAVVGSDAGLDVLPSGVEGVPMPVHQLLLVAMGTPILDSCDLERLSEACAAENRWEFFFTMAPLPVAGGTGSPVNPIAVF